MHGMQEVSGSIPLTSTTEQVADAAPCPAIASRSLSSRGPGHRPFTAVTRVRIPLGTPIIKGLQRRAESGT